MDSSSSSSSSRGVNALLIHNANQPGFSVVETRLRMRVPLHRHLDGVVF